MYLDYHLTEQGLCQKMNSCLIELKWSFLTSAELFIKCVTVVIDHQSSLLVSSMF